MQETSACDLLIYTLFLNKVLNKITELLLKLI